MEVKDNSKKTHAHTYIHTHTNSLTPSLSHINRHARFAHVQNEHMLIHSNHPFCMYNIPKRPRYASIIQLFSKKHIYHRQIFHSHRVYLIFKHLQWHIHAHKHTYIHTEIHIEALHASVLTSLFWKLLSEMNRKKIDVTSESFGRHIQSNEPPFNIHLVKFIIQQYSSWQRWWWFHWNRKVKI